MSPDVLCFSVPTFYGGTRYPSVNSMWATGARYGSKTPEYIDLFRAVRIAAWDVIKATGWETATDRCEVHLRRYVTTRRHADASNIGKVELDSMRAWKHGEEIVGFPGVYSDDHLVRPFFDITYDPAPEAVDRIAIAVFRLFTEPVGKAKPKPKAPKAEPVPHVVQMRTVAPTERTATLNGKPITVSEALALIGRDEKRR